MSDSLDLDNRPELAPGDRVQFVEDHRPRLEDGDYSVKVSQKITIDTPDGETRDHFGPAELRFSILGPRFVIGPELVHLGYPSPGQRGHFADTLPHVILERSTLPWERSAVHDPPPPGPGYRGPPPWLALLVFAEADAPRVDGLLETKTCTAGTLAASGVKYAGLPLERAQHAEDPVRVIDVEWGLLEKLLPTARELGLLCHVRRVERDGALLGPECCVVIANRLPEPGTTNYAHLVSLESRYRGDPASFDAQSAADADRVRLVSLHSWDFFCTADEVSFEDTLQAINGGGADSAALQLPAPETADGHGRARLAAGWVPVEHRMRDGGRTVSWYRGPLLPPAAVETGHRFDLPAPTADALLAFDTEHGMIDLSIASAWELGRLLALEDREFSTRLFAYKRSHAHSLTGQRQLVDLDWLPVDHGQSPLPPALDDPESRWLMNESLLARLSRLESVPWSYLVPDPEMLPRESVRVFAVDPMWIAALRDGAFSIGRVLDRDHELDSVLHTSLDQLAAETRTISGFLMRSSVVSAWPGLLIEAWAEALEGEERLSADPTEGGITRLEPVRLERLAPNVLLGLYVAPESLPSGRIRMLDFHLRPETLHFGFEDHPDPGNTSLVKVLRSAEDGRQIGQQGQPLFVQVRTRRSSRVVDIGRLFDDMAPSMPEIVAGGSEEHFTAAHFALQAIDSPPLVRLIMKP